MAVPTEELPWAPIYTVSRSGQPELTLYGIVYVWAEDRTLFANAGRSLLRIGNTRKPLWSRSLLKPWQFMAVFPTLKKAYPELTPQHFAVMMASQQGDPEQRRLLEEILMAGQLAESDLQCPACKPMRYAPESACDRLHHPCCGKHLAHLLYLKARDLPLTDYLNPDLEPYQKLRELLGYLLNRDLTIEEGTVDGCGMPNYALSAVETAQLYQVLTQPVSRDILRQAPDELEEMLEHWDELSAIFRGNPLIVGGERRLDTRLIQGEWSTTPDISVIAKEGADGLLTVGIGPNPRFADGLGIFVKLSSGYEPKQLELIIFELLAQLGLRKPDESDVDAVVQTEFHFQIESATAPA